MSRVSQLRTMYGQSSRTNPKPQGTQSVAAKWEANSSKNFKANDQVAGKKTFLHNSSNWPPKPQETSNDSSRNSSSKKPWEVKQESQKPWEKELENTPKKSINASAKTGLNEQNSSPPNAPWSQKKNDVKKSTSFNLNKPNQDGGFLHKRPSMPARQLANKIDEQDHDKTASSVASKPSWIKQQNQQSVADVKKEEENTPPWKKSSFKKDKKSSDKPPSNATQPITPKWKVEINKQSNEGEQNNADAKNEESSISRSKHSSFLYRSKPQTTEKKPTKPSPTNQSVPSPRKKRPLPDDVYQRPPPQKPRRPPNAKLPSQNAGKGSTAPGGQSLAPPLPSSKPVSNNFPPPPSPAKPRNLPAVVPSATPTTTPQNNDIYDDTDNPAFLPPPATSSPSAMPESFEEIPTWDEEDELAAVYDRTPDDIPPGEIPQGEEMYEDLDHYREFKGLNTASSAKDEEKSKKELKKEKTMRKKFSLPLEGEIPAECIAYARTEVKGFNKLHLSVNEKVEVIRRSNNPKGKWLVRTENGTYGYVEAENLSFELYERRAGPLPTGPPPSLPERAPTAPSQNGEAIYDDTAEDGEELYEEL